MNPPEITGTFQSDDGLNLFYRLCAKENARGLLVIAHGHGEHSGRYQKFYRMLEGLDLSIAIYDARGCGLSEGPHVYVDTFEDYLRDLGSFREHLRKRHGFHQKFILLGHSLGGLVATHWSLRHPDEIQALMLSSPCMGLRLPGFLIQFNRFMNCVAPKFYYRTLVYPVNLTHDPSEIEAYCRDSLIRKKISARLVQEMLLACGRLRALPTVRFSVPLFVLAAGLDRVVDLKATEFFFQRAEAPLKQMEIFPGFYHEIFNELGQEKAFEVLREDLEKIGVSTRPESR